MIKFKHAILHPSEASFLRRWRKNTTLEGFTDIRISRRFSAHDDFVELSWRVSTDSKTDPNSLFTRCLWSEIQQTIELFESRDLTEEAREFLK